MKIKYEPEKIGELFLCRFSLIKSVLLKKQMFILVFVFVHARITVRIQLCSRLSRPRFESRADGHLRFKCGPFINYVPKQAL